MRELSDDKSGTETGSDDDAGRGRQATSNPKEAEKPWLKEFNGYLCDIEDLGGWSIVRWWRCAEGTPPDNHVIDYIRQGDRTCV